MKYNGSAVVSYLDVITPFGAGGDVLFEKILNNESAIMKNERFGCSGFSTAYSATIPFLADNSKTILHQMAEILSERLAKDISNSRFIFASTVGEIEILQKEVENADKVSEKSTLFASARKFAAMFGSEKEPFVISAACASSIMAVEKAIDLINTGFEEEVVIFAADSVSEFVYSGFSSLQALDEKPATPFDKDRRGLSLGEGAGVLILKKDCEESGEKIKILASASSSDAYHMTSPSMDGGGLSKAINSALLFANISQHEIDFISAHGTGTKYNDEMEINAFKKCFDNATNVFSIKGAVGHTLGSAGMLQLAVSEKAMKEGIIPASTRLNTPDNGFSEWVTMNNVIKKSSKALVVNAGFGGLNSAMVISGGDY